jgi:hypothetical protein
MFALVCAIASPAHAASVITVHAEHAGYHREGAWKLDIDARGAGRMTALEDRRALLFRFQLSRRQLRQLHRLLQDEALRAVAGRSIGDLSIDGDERSLDVTVDGHRTSVRIRDPIYQWRPSLPDDEARANVERAFGGPIDWSRDARIERDGVRQFLRVWIFLRSLFPDAPVWDSRRCDREYIAGRPVSDSRRCY